MESSSTPKVSVVMANYNYGEFIEHAIDSVFSQSFQNFELIIVDDCSKDRSPDIINSWLEKDQRVRAVFHKKNEGIAKTFNDGIKMAKGEYILIMASDDMLTPNTLEICLNTFNYLEPQYGVVVFEAEIIDKNNKKVGFLFSELHRKPPTNKGNFFKELLKGNFIMTGMVRRKILYEQNIWFDEKLKHLNDWLFWLDLSYFYDFYYIEKPLYLYRVHYTNSSLDKKGYTEDISKIYCIIEKKYKLDNKNKSIVYSRMAKEYYMDRLNDPKGARMYLLKSIKCNPFNIKSYILYLFSFFQSSLLVKLLKTIKKQLKILHLRKKINNPHFIEHIKKRFS